MITAKEFFRNKLHEMHPNRVCISLANELITAEQGMRWAHEFKQLHLHLHGVMQGLHIESKPIPPDIAEIIELNWDKLIDGSPTVGKAGGDASVSDGK